MKSWATKTWPPNSLASLRSLQTQRSEAHSCRPSQLPSIWHGLNTGGLPANVPSGDRPGNTAPKHGHLTNIPTRPPAMPSHPDSSGRTHGAAIRALKSSKPAEHPFEQGHMGPSPVRVVPAGLLYGDKPGFGEVRDEDSGDSERQGEVRGDLRDGLDLLTQEPDPVHLGRLRDRLRQGGRGADQRLYREVMARTGTATGHRVGPDERGRLRGAARCGTEAGSCPAGCGGGSGAVRLLAASSRILLHSDSAPAHVGRRSRPAGGSAEVARAWTRPDSGAQGAPRPAREPATDPSRNRLRVGSHCAP